MPEMNINEVINKIRELKTFSAIDPEFYAKENGAAHVVAKDVKKKMKVTQLRKFFGHIKKIGKDTAYLAKEEDMQASKFKKTKKDIARALTALRARTTQS